MPPFTKPAPEDWARESSKSTIRSPLSFATPYLELSSDAAKRHGDRCVGVASPGKPAQRQEIDIEPSIAVQQHNVFVERAARGGISAPAVPRGSLR